MADALTSASVSDDVTSAALSSLHTKAIMAIMLVASKIATTQGLESIENKEADRDNKNTSTKNTKYNAYITVCKTKLDEIIDKDKVAFRNLDVGYKIKVTIFRLSPALYLKMYGAWKK